MDFKEDPKITIRGALPEEEDEIATLLGDAYRQYQTSLPSDAWEYYLQDVLDVRSRWDISQLIVSVYQGRLVGTVTLYFEPSFRHQSRWPEDWAGIRLLAVHPEYRNIGIGHALIKECVRRCRERGISTVGLHTAAFMEAAINLYKEMGFQRASGYDWRAPSGELIMAYQFEIIQK